MLAKQNIDQITLRQPCAEDGPGVSELIGQCPPLDRNSAYCNLLQVTHFADTCVVAESAGAVQGFVSGYRIPARPDTLFIWQVAVGEPARGQGLANRMLKHILNSPHCRGVNHLETTITKTNRASWALFTRLAETLNAQTESKVTFERDRHFAGAHDSEHLLHIGPFNSQT